MAGRGSVLIHVVSLIVDAVSCIVIVHSFEEKKKERKERKKKEKEKKGHSLWRPYNYICY